MGDHHNGWAHFASRNRVFLTRVSACVLVPLLLLTGTRWNGPGLQLMLLAGFVLCSLGAILRIWACMYHAGRRTKTLVHHGPFSVVRHPLYVGNLFVALGLGMFSGNPIFLIGLVLLMVVYYPGVISFEERDMLATHGEAYRTYMARTPRLLPDLKLLEEPTTVTLEVHRLHQILRGALAILGVMAAMYLFRWARESGVAPVLLLWP